VRIWWGGWGDHRELIRGPGACKKNMHGWSSPPTHPTASAQLLGALKAGIAFYCHHLERVVQFLGDLFIVSPFFVTQDVVDKVGCAVGGRAWGPCPVGAGRGARGGRLGAMPDRERQHQGGMAVHLVLPSSSSVLRPRTRHPKLHRTCSVCAGWCEP